MFVFDWRNHSGGEHSLGATVFWSRLTGISVRRFQESVSPEAGEISKSAIGPIMAQNMSINVWELHRNELSKENIGFQNIILGADRIVVLAGVG